MKSLAQSFHAPFAPFRLMVGNRYHRLHVVKQGTLVEADVFNGRAWICWWNETNLRWKRNNELCGFEWGWKPISILRSMEEFILKRNVTIFFFLFYCGCVSFHLCTHVAVLVFLRVGLFLCSFSRGCISKYNAVYVKLLWVWVAEMRNFRSLSVPF